MKYVHGTKAELFVFDLIFGNFLKTPSSVHFHPLLQTKKNSFGALQWLLATRIQPALVFGLTDAKTSLSILKFD